MTEKKAKIKIIVLIIVGILIITVATFALWQSTIKQNNNNNMGIACLNMTLGSENGDISIKDAWPKTDEQGGYQDPYTLTVTNNCNNPVEYSLVLEKIKDSNYPNNSDYLNSSYVKVKLNNFSPAILATYTPTNNDTAASYTILETRILYTDRLLNRETKTFSLRLWLDSNTPQRDANGSNAYKRFYAKLKLTAGQGFAYRDRTVNDDSCFTFDSATGTVSAYDQNTCGPNIIFPDSIGGVPIRTISSMNLGTGIEYVYLDNMKHLETIDDYAFFYYNTSTQSLAIPEGVTTIGYGAFYNFRGPFITLPSTLTTVEGSAFRNFTKTVYINMPQNSPLSTDYYWMGSGTTYIYSDTP